MPCEQHKRPGFWADLLPKNEFPVPAPSEVLPFPAAFMASLHLGR